MISKLPPFFEETARQSGRVDSQNCGSPIGDRPAMLLDVLVRPEVNNSYWAIAFQYIADGGRHDKAAETKTAPAGR